MSAAMNPYHGRHLRAKLVPDDDLSTPEKFHEWFCREMAKLMGSGDDRTRMQRMIDQLVDDATSPATSVAMRTKIIFGLMDRMGGKPMVRVESNGTAANVTIVEQQSQNLFLSDPGFQAKILEVEDYARARRSVGHEPGEIRGDREPGPMADEAPPGDPQPEDGRPGGAED